MKKIIRGICLIFLLVFTACFKHEPVLETIRYNEETLVYDSANNEYYTGTVKISSVNKEGVTYIEESYKVKKGRKHGKFKSYHPNGKLMMEFTFKDGKQEGLWKVYYRDGKLKTEIFIKDGELLYMKDY